MNDAMNEMLKLNGLALVMATNCIVKPLGQPFAHLELEHPRGVQNPFYQPPLPFLPATSGNPKPTNEGLQSQPIFGQGQGTHQSWNQSPQCHSLRLVHQVASPND